MTIRREDLAVTDFRDVAARGTARLAPTHPGDVLLRDFLEPMGITQYRLAKEIGVSQRRVGQIVAGERAVTADTALRLARFFGMSDSFWLSLQAGYDTATARDAMGEALAAIKPWRQAA